LWVDKWEDCTNEVTGADICQRDIGYFETVPDGSPLSIQITPQKMETPERVRWRAYLDSRIPDNSSSNFQCNIHKRR